jgi:hypothetical protein
MFKKKRLSSNFENQSYYQLIENLNNQNKNKNINIDSDLTLLFNIIIQLIKTIFLSPIFFLFSILFLFIKIEKSKYYFKKYIYLSFMGRFIKYILLYLLYITYWDSITNFFHIIKSLFGLI